VNTLFLLSLKDDRTLEQISDTRLAAISAGNPESTFPALPFSNSPTYHKACVSVSVSVCVCVCVCV